MYVLLYSFWIIIVRSKNKLLLLYDAAHCSLSLSSLSHSPNDSGVDADRELRARAVERRP